MVHPVVEALWSLAQAHPYLALFPLILLEGPLATLVAGSLVAVGAMTFPLAGGLAVAAEMTADLAIFTAGRLGRHERLRPHLHRLGLTDARRAALEASTARLPWVLAGAKVADVAAIPVILAAGASGVGYARFLTWDLALTTPKSLLLLALGALVGTQLQTSASPTTGVLVAVGAVAAYLALRALRALRTSRRAARLEGVPS
jgi:membrane-associated protein